MYSVRVEGTAAADVASTGLGEYGGVIGTVEEGMEGTETADIFVGKKGERL